MKLYFNPEGDTDFERKNFECTRNWRNGTLHFEKCTIWKDY